MIKLETIKKEDVASFYKWINDEEVVKYSLSVFQKIKSNTEIDQWFFTLIEDSKDFKLGIYLKENNQFLGYCGICNISKPNKSGEYFIFIGAKEYWGKGISTQVTKEILQIGFNQLDLNRIMLTVSKPNIGGVKSYKKAGFKEEGILREACFRDNQFHDKLMMSILKSEWKIQAANKNP